MATDASGNIKTPKSMSMIEPRFRNIYHGVLQGDLLDTYRTGSEDQGTDCHWLFLGGQVRGLFGGAH